MRWQFQDVKGRFGKVFKKALTEGPQEITREEGGCVFVVSEADYNRLLGERPSLKSLLFEGPSFDGLDLSRD